MRLYQSYLKWSAKKLRQESFFFLIQRLSLLLILLITFKAIDSSERISSYQQPRYFTASYYLICIVLYLTSRLIALLGFSFGANSTLFLLSAPKWMLSLLSKTSHRYSKRFCLDFAQFY